MVSDNQIGSFQPALHRIQDKLLQVLGDSHHARIIYRIVTNDGRYIDDTSTGFAPDKATAELKSMMEYLERYAFRLRTCHLKTEESDERIINEYLSLYEHTATESERDHVKDQACWGMNLSTREMRPIPLHFIFNYGRVPYIQSTTSGFAAHTDFKISLCNSVFELAERDAFVRFWHDPDRANNFEPDADVTSAIDSVMATLQTVLNNSNLSGHRFVVESPTRLPVVTITISSEEFSRPPSLCFGFGAGFDTGEALAGALKELRINASNLLKAESFAEGYLERKFTDRIETVQDRMNFYSTSSPREKLRFLDSDNPLPDGVVENVEPCTLDSIIDRFRQSCLDIHGIDFTPSCFRDRNVFVTRAFSPQLYPLQFGEEHVFNISTGPRSVCRDIPHFFI